MRSIVLNNSLRIPAIGLGTWKSAPGEVEKAIIDAIKAGYRHLDCAAIYMNEKEIGRALKQAFEEGLVKREELWVTSKLWNNAHKEEDVIPALKKTLADLQLDYLDLYLVHWPVAFKPGVMNATKGDDFLTAEEAPIADTWKKMEEAVALGLAKSIGVSNFSVKKLRSLLEHCNTPPVMNQVELHPYLAQNALVDFCQRNGVALTAYSPLGSRDRPDGLKKEDEPSLMQNPVIVNIAEKHGATPAQILIAWHVHRNYCVIPKSTNPERIVQNLESAKIALDQSDMLALEALDKRYRYVDGKFFEANGEGYVNVFDE